MHNFDKIRFVVATRVSDDEFFLNTLTGKSLKMYEGLGFELDLYHSNITGLPVVYNQSIEKAKSNPAILIFVHDDVFFLDFWWIKKIRDALKVFDIAGVAGNIRRLPGQPTWCHKDKNFNYDDGFMSGAIGKGSGFPPDMLCVYGPSPLEVKLIDGVFIACHSDTLLANNIYFDPLFDFHYYDLDFCRSAEIKNLKIGTVEISLIHESGGSDSPDWKNSMTTYFNKWGN